MGVPRETLEEAAQFFVQQSVAADLGVEVSQLLGGRQLAVDQEVGGLQEGGVLGQLLNGVAAVAQDTCVAVDVGDRRAAGGGVDEARVESDATGLLQQLGYVVRVAPLCGVDQRACEFLITGAQGRVCYVDTHKGWTS
jgi:hypothetical protein